MPVAPRSVAPKGIPARPTDNVGDGGDESRWLSAQESAVFRDSPPPSNRSADDELPTGAPQAVIPLLPEKTAGLMPGVVISVAPSGMPAGRAERMARGDVAPMPADGAACPEAGIGHAVPIINDASRKMMATERRAKFWAR